MGGLQLHFHCMLESSSLLNLVSVIWWKDVTRPIMELGLIFFSELLHMI